jgi:hypothetical protein
MAGKNVITETLKPVKFGVQTQDNAHKKTDGKAAIPYSGHS